MEQAKEQLREARIQQWFSMWLDKCDTGIETLFAPDAVYIESWGPEYHGSEKIKLWFEEWNTRGMVQRWDIRQYFHQENQTVVEWVFQCAMAGETAQSFDGLSLIRWTRRIRFVSCRNSAATKTAMIPMRRARSRFSGMNKPCGSREGLS